MKLIEEILGYTRLFEELDGSIKELANAILFAAGIDQQKHAELVKVEIKKMLEEEKRKYALPDS